MFMTWARTLELYSSRQVGRALGPRLRCLAVARHCQEAGPLRGAASALGQQPHATQPERATPPLVPFQAPSEPERVAQQNAWSASCPAAASAGVARSRAPGRPAQARGSAGPRGNAHAARTAKRRSAVPVE